MMGEGKAEPYGGGLNAVSQVVAWNLRATTTWWLSGDQIDRVGMVVWGH